MKGLKALFRSQLRGLLSTGVWVFAAGINAAQAVTPSEAFLALREVEDDFVNTGTICEHVAKLELQKEFDPKKYDTWIGISYSVGQEVIGELDAVVLDRASRKVVLIGEVKCWRNLEAGLEKAHSQEERFRSAVRGEYPYEGQIEFFKMQPGSDPIAFDSWAFDRDVEYISIGQKGAVAAGYDRELEMGLEDLMQVRKQILSIKRRGN